MRLVILCGGSGTRLWPVSRVTTPKQFAKLFDDKSLFELTIERNLEFFDTITVVVNSDQYELCKSQIPKSLISKTTIIIEPCPRNTAPAIALAALANTKDDLFIVPSDHLIKDMDIYKKCILKAQEISKNDRLVTFGLKPTRAETGFGYIEAKDTEVLAFKEKPSIETANNYISRGNFLWNSGMFYFNAEFFLSELKRCESEIFEKAKIAFDSTQPIDNVLRIEASKMNEIPSKSIDYAVMEKSKSVSVVKSEFYWTDLGSFDSLSDVLEQDTYGNTIFENYIQKDSRNNLIIGSKRLIATFDVKDLIIVDTEDALLIGKKGNSQKVKELLEIVKEKRPELLK